MNLVKSYMRWLCWSISWASTAEWTAIWKRLMRLRWTYTTERENSALLFPTFSHSWLCYLIQAKLRLYWERTWWIILRDSDFTRLTMSIDNREILKFSTFNALIHGCIWFNSGKVTSLLGKSDGLSYVTRWVRLYFLVTLHKLHIRHLFNTSNLCINGCYVK